MKVGLPEKPLRLLIEEQGKSLLDKLTDHRLETFPPTSAKIFRKLSPAETSSLLGVAESYLRAVALEIDDQLSTKGQARRSYTLEDVQVLRRTLEERSRTPGKLLPGRRAGEHLQVIAVINFKGGSAKTTTSANLAQYLAIHGYRTLAIDLDPQASLTSIFGVAPEVDVGPNQSLYGAIHYGDDAVPLRDIIRRTYIPGLDLVPAALELMEFEHETATAAMKQKGGVEIFGRIMNALLPVEADYDVVVIDCPPQLGFLSLSALISATAVLVTVHPEMLDVMSMSQFLTMLGSYLNVVHQQTGHDPPHNFIRYLLTRFEPSDGPQNQIVGFLRSIFKGYVLNHPALKSTAISDAGLTSQTIYEVERNQFTRSTYDRALESVNAVNGEIEQLIHAAWGRP